MIVRRLARSAIAPPTNPSRSTGRFPQKLTVPRTEAERVMSYTSQPSAICWIQKPRLAISEPDQNRR